MVNEAIWEEDSGMWRVSGSNVVTGNPFEDRCHVLINGSGILK